MVIVSTHFLTEENSYTTTEHNNWNSYELGDSYYDSSWSYVGKMAKQYSQIKGNQSGIESNINTHYNIY